jgi:hypothetical protein
VLLALVTPAWRRYGVSRLCFAQRAALRERLAGRGISVLNIVVADDENLDIALRHGFTALERPNFPLGRKWNEGIALAGTLGADFVAVVGSDDWVHEDLFRTMPLDHTPTPDFPADGSAVVWDPELPQAITGRGITLVDLLTGRARSCRVRNQTGVIPWVMPRKALEPSGFRPVADTAEIGLDGSMVAGLGTGLTWQFHDPHPLARVDFKSGTNLNSYDRIAGAIGEGEEIDPWPALRTKYPAWLVANAEKLSEEMRAGSHLV